MRARSFVSAAVVAALVLTTLLPVVAFAEAQTLPEAPQGQGSVPSAVDTAALAISAAFVVAMACLAAGFAVARVGSAAMGAASERPELLGRTLIFVALGEGIAIVGFVIGFLLLLKIK